MPLLEGNYALDPQQDQGYLQEKDEEVGNFTKWLQESHPERDHTAIMEGVRLWNEGGRVSQPSLSEFEGMGRKSLVQQNIQLGVEPEPEQGWLETGGKALARGGLGIMSGLGAAERWAGEALSKATGGAVGGDLAEVGKEASSMYREAAQAKSLRPDPGVFAGSFEENPSLKRAFGVIAEAIPSLAAAVGVSAATGSPIAGATLLGLTEGAPQYEEAREKGKGVGEASIIGGASTVGTTLLEYLPLSRMLRRAGRVAEQGGKRVVAQMPKKFGGLMTMKYAQPGRLGTAAMGAVEEGLQEGSQQLWQNLVAKVGYDDSRKLAEGLIESMIGGAGAGGFTGAAIARARGKGVTSQEIQAAQLDLMRQVIGTAREISSTDLAEDMQRPTQPQTAGEMIDDVSGNTDKLDAVIEQGTSLGAVTGGLFRQRGELGEARATLMGRPTRFVEPLLEDLTGGTEQAPQPERYEGTPFYGKAFLQDLVKERPTGEQQNARAIRSYPGQPVAEGVIPQRGEETGGADILFQPEERGAGPQPPAQEQGADTYAEGYGLTGEEVAPVVPPPTEVQPTGEITPIEPTVEEPMPTPAPTMPGKEIVEPGAGGEVTAPEGPTIIPISKDLKITNIEQLPKGTGARYLEVTRGHGGDLIAKQWRRKPTESGILIDYEATVAAPEAKAKEPWEQTVGEFAQTRKPPGDTLKTYAERMAGYRKDGDEKVQGQVTGNMLADKVEAQAETIHKAEIKAAVRRGEKVPPEVLAEYPELAKPKEPTVAEKTESGEIFIRALSKSETANPAKHLPTIPEKEGYEKVYKPYGSEGKGFYYVKAVEKAIPAPEEPAQTKEEMLAAMDKFFAGDKVATKIKPGWAWIDNQQRPFTEYQEIKRGRNKGKVRLTISGKPKIVDRSSVKEWPGEGESTPAKPVPEAKAAVSPALQKRNERRVANLKKIAPTLTGAEATKAQKRIAELEGKEGEVVIKETAKGPVATTTLTKAEESKLSLKEQKEYLFAEIDKAIEQAPEEDSEINLIQNKLSKINAGILALGFDKTQDAVDEYERLNKARADILTGEGFITIEIPGDGKYRILNRKAELQRFKKQAKEFPLPEPKKRSIVTKNLPQPSAQRKEGLGELYKVEGGQWITDSHVLIKSPPPKNARWTQKQDKPIPLSSIKSVIPTDTVPAKLAYFAFDYEGDVGVSAKPMPTLGVEVERHTPKAIFESQGKQIIVNQLLLNSIRNRYPNATFEAAKESPESRGIVAKDKGKVVGMVMPVSMKMSAFSKEFQDLISIPETKLSVSPTSVHIQNARTVAIHFPTWISKTGLSPDRLRQITLDLRNSIQKGDLSNAEASMQDWVELKGKANKIVGATTLGKDALGKLHATVMLALNRENLNDIEKTTYHESFHILKRWALSDHVNSRLDRIMPNEEAQAEAFAKSTYEGVRSGFVKRVFTQLREFLKAIQNGLRGLGFTTPEMIFRQIRKGEKAVSGGKATGTGINEFAASPRLSMKEAAKSITENPNFRRWFGGSKVVDEAGEPLVVYHGTPENFDAFDLDKTWLSQLGVSGGLGAYFSTDPKEASHYAADARRTEGSVIPAYISISNPKVIYRADGIWDRILASKSEAIKVRNELKDQGFDGALTPLGEWVAFSPTQIKSIFNSGEFDPSNPDIRFQIVHHGTPHVWAPEKGFPHGRPRLDKIGTGEGAAAYGWGWYSAEAEDVGKVYRDRDSYNADAARWKNLWQDFSKRFPKAADAFAEDIASYSHNRLEPGALGIELEGFYRSGGNHRMIEAETKKMLEDAALQGYVLPEKEAGSLYTLDIPNDVQPKLLDWDKPLGEQSEYVKGVLEDTDVWKSAENITDGAGRSGLQTYTGKDLYDIVANKEDTGTWRDVADQKAASEYLASIGIPGNKYLDQGSRRYPVTQNAETGKWFVPTVPRGFATKEAAEKEAEKLRSRNYVIWDQPTLDRIAILERNGEKLDAIREAENETRLSVSAEDDVPARTAAKDNNARYDGRWSTVEGQPYAFTDNLTKSSIMVYDLRDLPVRLDQMRRAFKDPSTPDTKMSIEELEKGDKSVKHIIDQGKELFGPAGRFGKGYVSRKDIRLWNKVFSLPYWLGKKFPSMHKAIQTEIAAHEDRSKMLFDDYDGDLGRIQDDLPKDPVAYKEFKDLLWKYEGKRFNKNAVPTDWHKEIKAGGDIEINPEHYEQVEKYLNSKGYNPKAIDAFMAIRKKLDEKFVDIDKILRHGVKDIDPTIIEEYRAQIKDVHNYFPHRRTGNSYIQILGPQKEVVYRAHYNSMTERLKGGFSPDTKVSAVAEKWLNDQLKSGELQGNFKDYTFSQGEVTELPDEVFFQIPLEAMQQILDVAGRKLEDARHEYEAARLIKKGIPYEEAKAEAKRLLTADLEKALSNAVADVIKSRGFGKHALHRKGIPGHETEDVFGILFDYLSGYAGFKTKIDRSQKHHDTLRKVDAKANPGEYTYLSKYVKDVLSNQTRLDRLVDGARGLFFVKYLGFVPKSGLVNLTQNVVLAAPVLSQYTKGGLFKAERVLGKAMFDVRKALTSKEAWTGKEVEYKLVNPTETQALKDLVETGATQDMFLRELKGNIPGVGMAGKMMKKVIDKSGIFMQLAEKFNRASTGLAAFRVAYDNGVQVDPETNTKGDYEKSLEFAKQVIYDSHFLYGNANLPELMRGGDIQKVLRTGYTFRTFTHNYISAMAHLAMNQGPEGKKAFFRSLRNLFAVGGLASMPFFTVALEALMWALGDDDEDALTLARSYMPSEWMKDMVTYGMPGVAGIDFTGSLSIEAPKTWGDFLGVPYSVGKDIMNVTESLRSGANFRALSEMPFTPLSVRNAMRGYELYTEGQRTRSGKDINYYGKEGPARINAPEAVAKGLLGFQPTSVSKGFKAYQATQDLQESVQRRKTKWADRYVNAMRKEDKKAMTEILKEVAEWNTNARADNEPYKVIDIRQAIKYRLRPNIQAVPVAMRGRAKEIASTWGGQ